MVEEFNIKTKKVFISETHNFSICAWGKTRRILPQAPILVSFDRHTDVYSPFLRASLVNCKIDAKLQKSLMSKLDYNSDKSLVESAQILYHDEQIRTAIATNVISKAIIICYANSENLIYQNDKHFHPKEGRSYESGTIFIPKHGCYVGCNLETQQDECIIPHFNDAIDSKYLEKKFLILSQWLPKLVNNKQVNSPFILDIDLDYFHTLKSIKPQSSSFFYNLIRKCEAVTITKEEKCVMESTKYDSTISVELLLEKMIEHIKLAMESSQHLH